MSDLISRQAAIEAIGKSLHKGADLLTDTFVEGIEQVLEALPSAQQGQRWIPVSERLPEEGVPVLVSAYGNITDGVHERGWWLAWGDRGSYEDEENVVDAWMPLPEPYKEKQG